MTWISFLNEINFKRFQLKKIIQVLNSIPWVRCASGNVFNLFSTFYQVFYKFLFNIFYQFFKLFFLHCIALPQCLGYWVGIELISSSARVTSIKSANGVGWTEWVTSGPIDRTPGTPGSDKNSTLHSDWGFSGVIAGDLLITQGFSDVCGDRGAQYNSAYKYLNKQMYKYKCGRQSLCHMPVCHKSNSGWLLQYQRNWKRAMQFLGPHTHSLDNVELMCVHINITTLSIALPQRCL